MIAIVFVITLPRVCGFFAEKGEAVLPQKYIERISLKWNSVADRTPDPISRL